MLRQLSEIYWTNVTVPTAGEISLSVGKHGKLSAHLWRMFSNCIGNYNQINWSNYFARFLLSYEVVPSWTIIKPFKPVCNFSLKNFKYKEGFVSIQWSLINKMFQLYGELLHFSPLVSLGVRKIQDTSSILVKKSLARQITEFSKIHFLIIFLGFLLERAKFSAVSSYYSWEFFSWTPHLSLFLVWKNIHRHYQSLDRKIRLWQQSSLPHTIL